MYGHSTPLYILPFDHRSSFASGIFGQEHPDAETVEKIRDMKRLVFEALLESQSNLSLPAEQLGVLVDEEYGSDILTRAAELGFTTFESTEKSGEEEFSFEYDADFATHILNSKLSFVKALVRYNPEGNETRNQHSLERLKKLSDFVHEHNIKLLIEPLIPATPAQLAKVAGDKRRFDTEIRPELTKRMVGTFQEAGIECDVWKIEGFEKREAYEEALTIMRNTLERQNVGLIILGRNETPDRVAAWLEAGKGIPGVLGFAVGRTVFWNPLISYRDGAISRQEAITQIAKNFEYFTKIFLS